jgi:Polyketide cyclase / dehydrase and lipid transport
MPRFTSSVEVAAPIEAVWRRMTDWPVHGRWIPLTTVRVTTERPDGLGARFVARSGLGPIGFDDPMEIVEWLPPANGRPGHCRVQKLGRVVLGWASFDVEARSDGGSTVVWTEDVQIAPVWLTRPADGLISAGGRFGFDRALGAMARELEAEVAADG